MASIHARRPRTKAVTDDELNKLPPKSERQFWVDELLEIGDWVFYDFELMQIVDEHSVSNGTVRIGGFRRAFHCPIHPMNMQVKRISDGYKFFYAEISKTGDTIAGINWPDIHRAFVNHWHLACLGKVEHPVSWAQDFCAAFDTTVKQLKTQMIKDVPLFHVAVL